MFAINLESPGDNGLEQLIEAQPPEVVFASGVALELDWDHSDFAKDIYFNEDFAGEGFFAEVPGFVANDFEIPTADFNQQTTVAFTGESLVSENLSRFDLSESAGSELLARGARRIPPPKPKTESKPPAKPPLNYRFIRSRG